MGMMEVCGATGGLMLAGLKNSAGVESPEPPKALPTSSIARSDKHFQQSTGSVLCHELKGRDTGTPPARDTYLQQGAQLVENIYYLKINKKLLGISCASH